MGDNTSTSEAAHTSDETEDNDGLLSRIRLIEDQPLESRASAFAQLHEELQSALEGSDHQR
jgi:hypothetical protein